MIVSILVAIHLLAIGWLLYWLLQRNPAYRGKRTGSVRLPIEEVLALPQADIQYGINHLSSPKVTGHLLQFITWFSYTRLGDFLITKPSTKQSNLDIFKGEYIPEEPTFKPHFELSDKPVNVESNQLILNNHLKTPREKLSSQFFHNTIIDYYHAYKSGETTPTAVAKDIIQAINESNQMKPPLRAVIQSFDSVVMEMAEASTERWKNHGETLSLLDGIPVAVKDELLVEPYPFFAGGKFKLSAHTGIKEGALVSTLKESGAIIIGISNMQEFGCGTIGSNPHSNYLTPRNPYNTNHYCGGSSSGSAASVAAGLCPLAIGADGGGSIRIPSSLCGVVGLKPTYDLVCKTGSSPLDFTVGVAGPISASTLDAAIFMNAIDEKNQVCLKGLGDAVLEGLKVGIYWEYFEHADEDTVKQCRNSLKFLTDIGVQLVDIAIPELEESRVAHMIVILSEMASLFAPELDAHFWDFAPETRTPTLIGINATSTEYLNCLKQRTRSIAIVKSLFEEVDIIITPTTGCTAPKIDPRSLSHGIVNARASGELMRFAFLGNFVGIPALTIPVGTDKEGLPIGLQLMGKWYSEGLLLKVGHALEKAMNNVMPKPQVYYDILQSYN